MASAAAAASSARGRGSRTDGEQVGEPEHNRQADQRVELSDSYETPRPVR